MLRPRTFGIVSTALFIALASSASAADAPPVAHQVGPAFYDNNGKEAGTDGFVLVTVEGKTRIGGIFADIYKDPGQPADRLVIGFYDKDEWSKFVALWRKVVHSPRPSKSDDYTIHTDGESYFDPETEADVSISKKSDGTIAFAFAGKPDSDKHPTVIGLIHLPPGRIKEFNQDIRTVSAFLDAK